MRFPRRKKFADEGGRADWLIVGLGNPGSRYAGTRHNVGFEVANLLASRWDLPRGKDKFKGRFTEGRASPGCPRVAILLPQTYMNESGSAVSPARGALGVALENVLAIHDEIETETEVVGEGSGDAEAAAEGESSGGE